jgi:hypothetical protein
MSNAMQEVEQQCNAGSRTTNWIGDFPGIPEPVWLDEAGRCNILSMKRVKKYYRIVYDSDNGHGFIVTHREKGTSKAFFESKKGLHYRLKIAQSRRLTLK